MLTRIQEVPGLPAPLVLMSLNPPGLITFGQTKNKTFDPPTDSSGVLCVISFINGGFREINTVPTDRKEPPHVPINRPNK